MTISVEQGLGGQKFGCTVRGITMEDVHDEGVRALLRKHFIQDGMIVFRDTHVTDEMHLEISRVIGPLVRHPFADQMKMEGHPDLIQLKYDGKTEAVYDVDGELMGSYAPWHFDGVFVEKINRGGILRIVTLPRSGGLTGYIDGIEAYDRLPQRTKERIEKLYVVYQVNFEWPYSPRQKVRIVEARGLVGDSMQRVANGDFPPVAHPLVYQQADTGKKILNFSPMFAKYVEGMDQAESDDLLMEIGYHVTDERYAYFHEWKSRDELVLWDNWRMLHKASGVPIDTTRAVCRTTIAGDYGLGRKVA